MARLAQQSPPQKQGDQSKWTFEQLGGPRKSLELSGFRAPLGRPRIGPVTSESLKLRHDEVHYDGGTPPTRHVFGILHEPIELNGRWSDFRLGRGEAKRLVEEVRAFVADAQPVLVTWADNVRVTGLVEEIKVDREAHSDVTWMLRILVDTDDLLGTPPPAPPAPPPGALLGNPMQEMGLDNLTKVPPTLRVGPFEALSQLIAEVAEVGAELDRVANEIASFARAPLNLLKQLRATISGFRTNIIRLRNSVELLPAEYALESRRTSDEVEWATTRSSFEANAIAVMFRLAAMDRFAAVAERGQTKTLHLTKTDDTFESMATEHYGSAGRANDIRDANGVAAGSDPVDGTLYRIPK